MFLQNVFNEEPVSRIFKSSRNSVTRQTTHDPIKSGKNANRHTSREDVQMAEKHARRFSAALVSEIQGKTRV